MSMYGTLFGQNPAAGLLCAILGKRPADFGRFRDAFVAERNGEPVIAVYTRNGGGNRSCFCEDDPRYGYKGCRHRVEEEEVDETVELPDEEGRAKGYAPCNIFVGSKRMFKTGKRVMHPYYVCEAPGSDECACPGCTITYRLPELEGYIRDEDDDFDSTYATIYFRPPEEYREVLAGAIREGTPSEDWAQFIAALEDPPDEPKTDNEKRAVALIASLKEAS
jgi:hypothetical protein